MLNGQEECEAKAEKQKQLGKKKRQKQ